jgi:hypothetical protein
MKPIKFYNNRLDYIFISKDESENMVFDYELNEFEYQIDGVKVIQYKQTEEFDFENIDFDSEYLHIFILSSLKYGIEKIQYLVEKYGNTNVEIFIIADTCAERNIFHNNDDNNESIVINLISNTNNIKVIHHRLNFNNKNFIFFKKLPFLGLLYNCKSLNVYHYFSKYWANVQKPNKFGFHLNRIYNSNRLKFFKELIQTSIIENEKFYCTISETDKKSTLFEPAFNKFLYKNNDTIEFGDCKHDDKTWYFSNLFDLSIKSDIELIYETNAEEPTDSTIKTFTEKSMKMLWLGKPFISIDPNTHKFIQMMGFKTYDLLLSPNLLHLYNQPSEVNNNPNDWRVKSLNAYLFETIQNILNMPDLEYTRLLDECKEVSEYNKSLVDKILYKETIVDLLKSQYL